jgi:hypothetical protein
MEAMCFSQMSVDLYHIMWHQIPEAGCHMSQLLNSVLLRISWSNHKTLSCVPLIGRSDVSLMLTYVMCIMLNMNWKGYQTNITVIEDVRRWVCRPYAPATLNPQENFGYPFLSLAGMTEGPPWGQKHFSLNCVQSLLWVNASCCVSNNE